MTLQQIANKIYRLTKTNSTSYPNQDIVDDINIQYSDTTADLFLSDGRWQWDDTNQSDLPVATADIVASQQDYALSVAHLIIDRVEVKANGAQMTYRLSPRDVEDPMWGSYFIGLDNVSTAAPMQYDLAQNSIFLYPIPNYSQAASLKVYFRRAQIDFSTGDLSAGTINPGFASLFHDILAYKVAYDYAVINLPSLAQGYLNLIQLKTQKLKTFYDLRDKDDAPRLAMRPILFR